MADFCADPRVVKACPSLLQLLATNHPPAPRIRGTYRQACSRTCLACVDVKDISMSSMQAGPREDTRNWTCPMPLPHSVTPSSAHKMQATRSRKGLETGGGTATAHEDVHVPASFGVHKSQAGRGREGIAYG